MRYRAIFLSILTIPLLLTVFILPAHAGWVEKDRHSGTMYISERGLVKNVPPGKSMMWSIMDLQDGTVTMVNTRTRTYTIIYPEKFCSQVSSMMNNMMEGMPPEQRAMMAEMMGGKSKKPAPRVTVSKKGSGGKMQGYSTIKYSVTVNGRAYKDVWLAVDAPIMRDVRKFISKSTEMSAQMESCSDMGPGAEGPAPETSKEYAALAKKGWPMKAVNLKNGKVEKEVLSLEKKSIPSSEFHVPTGYRKVEMREMMGGMRR
ncbi:MAG: DUF4412 domain-containing protein [Thermodesulfobacteriota bacterium]